MTATTIDNWAADDPPFAEALAEARALGWDHLAAECLEIADDASGDIVVDADGVPHNTNAVLRARLAIETRLKLLRVWDGTRYGDTKSVKIDADVRVEETHRMVLDPALLTEAQRQALVELLDVAQAQGLLIEGEAREVTSADADEPERYAPWPDEPDNDDEEDASS